MLLGLPVMVWLGRVSYSTYLCHNRVFTFVDETVLRLMNAPTPMVRSIALLVIGVPLVAAASGALYYLVENPGIQLGKRLAKQLDRRPRPAAIEEAEAGVLPGAGAG